MISDSPHHSQKGFSLVMSLIFISLLSILVVGFLTSMRTEVSMAESHVRSEKASNFAQAGTDMALSRLRYALCNGTAGMSIWASQPGRVIVATRSSTLTGFSPSQFQFVDLHSGAGAYNDSDAISADLNGGSQHLITGKTEGMRVKWIYMLKNGTLSTSVPVYSATDPNPMVGRFAYWVDDETARINLNTALRRDTGELWAAPSQVNLKVFNTLTDPLLTQFNAYRNNPTGGRPYFNTLQEVRAAGIAELTQLLNAEKFSLTVNSQAPDLNMFGEPRIVLTTQRGLAGNAPFLDILNKDNADPGVWANLSAPKVNIAVASLSQILNRSDWPVTPASSFGGKFAPVQSQQIALNIIEYVRAKESGIVLVDAIRGTSIGTDSFSMALGNSGTMMGNSRSLKITEMAFYVKQDGTAVPPRYRITARVEIHNPINSHIPQLNLETVTLTGFIYMNVGVVTASSGIYIENKIGASATYGPKIIGTEKNIAPGKYLVVEAMTNPFLLTGTDTIASITTIRPGLSLKTAEPNARMTYTTVDDRIAYTFSSLLPETSTWPSLSVDDPALSIGVANWVNTGTQVTFGTISGSLVNTLGTNPTVVPPQDKDGTGLTNIGMQLPSPAWDLTGNNRYGVMESVAELGYIHTGITTKPNVKGTSWRTLRLQPKSDNTLPDWLLLDMFAVPKKHWKDAGRSESLPASLDYYAQPEVTTPNATNSSVNGRVGGAVNVNATLVPGFTLADGTTLLTRTTSLQAAFYDAYSDAASSARQTSVAPMAGSIAARTLSGVGGNLYGLSTSSPLISRGQIAEMSGVTDGGEENENKLRGVVDLLTTRGSVFRIYAVGQAVRQTSATTISVLGEKRTETVVERVSNATGTEVKLNIIANQITRP